MNFVKKAEEFATALDQEDYESALVHLSLECRYDAKDGPLSGRKAIIDSYMEAGEWVRDNINEHRYEHCVRLEPEGLNNAVIITFVDHLIHQGIEHTFTCEQRMLFGKDGTIDHIEQIELPQQRAHLNEWFKKVGLSRPSSTKTCA
jgi:hypothetical protein